MRLSALRALAQDATMDPASGLFFGTGQTDVTSPVAATMQPPSYAAPAPLPPLVVLPPIAADTTPSAVSIFSPAPIGATILNFPSSVNTSVPSAPVAAAPSSGLLLLLGLAAAGLAWWSLK